MRNWLVMMKRAYTCPNSDMGSFGDFCVCIQTQSNLVMYCVHNVALSLDCPFLITFFNIFYLRNNL